MDASRLEKRTHGTEEFPFQIYPMTGSQDGDVIPYHWHPELEIIRILAGEVGLTIADRQYTGLAGDLFFVATGELHEIRSGTGGQFRSFVFPADFLQFRRADRAQETLLSPLAGGQLWFPTELRAGGPGHVEILSALDAVMDACAHRREGFELKVKASLPTGRARASCAAPNALRAITVPSCSARLSPIWASTAPNRSTSPKSHSISGCPRNISARSSSSTLAARSCST